MNVLERPTWEEDNIYIQGQTVPKKSPKPDKLGLHEEGPYLITQVHTNGNATIELRPRVTERILEE